MCQWIRRGLRTSGTSRKELNLIWGDCFLILTLLLLCPSMGYLGFTPTPTPPTPTPQAGLYLQSFPSKAIPRMPR